MGLVAQRDVEVALFDVAGMGLAPDDHTAGLRVVEFEEDVDVTRHRAAVRAQVARVVQRFGHGRPSVAEGERGERQDNQELGGFAYHVRAPFQVRCGAQRC